MPKVKPLIPTEIVLTQLDTLSGLIQIIPEQASMLLGVSTEQLKDMREEGRPPAHIKQGGAIRYQLGVVRDYLKSKASFNNSGEAAVYAKNNPFCFGSFGDFMQDATLDDTWPFLIVQKTPIDLFTSLSLQGLNDDCQGKWLSLESYCTLRIQNEQNATTALNRSTPDFPSLLPFTSFTDFLTLAGRKDTWPFLVVDDKPLDLFNTLSLDVDEDTTCGEWLSLEQYCDDRVIHEKHKMAKSEQEDLLSGYTGPTDLPTNARRTP